MSFNYSYWKTFREAKIFADGLLSVGGWDDKKLDSHPDEFHKACHALAKSLGQKERYLVPIG